ncbi:MAG: MaoC/PaaZ C-terminal domain-containing protein [Thermoplasmatales archaeon]|nr:enoyl-CoA hydratase [Candidatus Thermoplasmatota archaeon]MCL6002573.1 enoyl-CoA hydratase [Candidatus Thermoplasmatota archaeon]MDA8055644.1 MaoC/PaaZ C-terminal domain-containing protein [Thermoplasmatales archaeon]
MEIKVGQKTTHTRVFTEDDVKLFGDLSGDKGIHHVQPDSLGRIMVQGLLTATIPTKIGGDMNFIARDGCFHFLRPVYVGDTVKCEAEVTKAETDERYVRLSIESRCVNQLDEQVMTGEISGVIRLKQTK